MTSISSSRCIGSKKKETSKLKLQLWVNYRSHNERWVSLFIGEILKMLWLSPYSFLTVVSYVLDD